MKESGFISYVVRKLPPHIHSQSMTFGSLTHGGTPDRYFDGPSHDLWVEFKYIDAMPRSRTVGGVDDKKRGCYSSKQYNWMCRRQKAGGNVLGIVGLPNRMAVVQTDPAQWKNGSPIEEAIPWSEVAARIARFCSEARA